MDAAHRRAPADRGGRRHPVRAARRRRRWTTASSWPAASGERIARAVRPAGLPVRRGGDAGRSGSSSPTSDAAGTRGSSARSACAGREPDFGPARMHPSAGAVAVGARPFLIAYNINLDSRDVELAKRIARRVRESGGGLPRVQANGFWIEELGRAQVSMNLLDFAITPLWLRLGDGPRRRRRGRRRARRIRADRARAAGRLPGRRRPGRRPARGPGRATPRGRGRATCGCATSRRCRPSSCGSRPPGPAARRSVTRRPVPADPGRPERRADARAPDRRRGRGRDARRRRPDGRAPGRRRPADRGRTSAGPMPPDAPVVACWEGRIAAVGPRAALETGARGGGLPARAVRPARRRRRHRDARVSSIRTPTCCSPARARASWLLRQRGAGYLEILAAGGGILSTVAATRAATLDDAHGPRPALARRDARATGSRRSRRSPATGSTSRPRSGSSRSPTGSARKARSTSSRPISAPTPCRPSSAPGPMARRRTSGRSSRSSCPGVAAHGRARFCDVFCETGVFTPDQSRRILEAAAGYGLVPRLHADELAPSRRRGAGRRARRRVGRPPGDPVRGRHRRARPRPPPSDRPGRGDRPAGDDLVPHEGPRRAGADVHRARHPGRDRHGLQPRHVTDGRACRWR